MTFDFTTVRFEDVDCLVCKSKDHLKKLFTTKDFYSNLPGDFSIVRCEKCSLVFQSPRPEEKFIGHYYPDDLGYFDVPKNEDTEFSPLAKSVLTNYYGYKHLGSQNILEKIFLFPAYIYLYKHRSIPYYKEKGSVLEIGCSNGLSLQRLKNAGWQTKGIEMNHKAAAYARNHRGLDVEAGSIFEFDFPSKAFDVIILDMVLEHLYNPDEAIQKISTWLKPGGQLIFSIPYFNGFEFQFFGKFTYALHLPAHITFFNKNGIRHILKDFHHVRYSFHHFDRDVIASAQYTFENTQGAFYGLIARNKVIRWALVKPLVFLCSLIGKTSRVTVSATKG